MRQAQFSIFSSFFNFFQALPFVYYIKTKRKPKSLTIPAFQKKLRKAGLEPARHCCHKILSLARLPIPTLPHMQLFVALLIVSDNM